VGEERKERQRGKKGRNQGRHMYIYKDVSKRPSVRSPPDDRGAGEVCVLPNAASNLTELAEHGRQYIFG